MNRSAEDLRIWRVFLLLTVSVLVLVTVIALVNNRRSIEHSFVALTFDPTDKMEIVGFCAGPEHEGKVCLLSRPGVIIEFEKSDPLILKIMKRYEQQLRGTP